MISQSTRITLHYIHSNVSTVHRAMQNAVLIDHLSHQFWLTSFWPGLPLRHVNLALKPLLVPRVLLTKVKYALFVRERKFSSGSLMPDTFATTSACGPGKYAKTNMLHTTFIQMHIITIVLRKRRSREIIVICVAIILLCAVVNLSHHRFRRCAVSCVHEQLVGVAGVERHKLHVHDLLGWACHAPPAPACSAIVTLLYNVIS